MTRINQRLVLLERKGASRKVISGLSHFYDLIEVTDAVGGGRALIDRVDAGTADDADRAAIAAVPGGVRAIREHVVGVERFYGGTP